MRFRKTLTLLVLAIGLVFALSAVAQQKPFTQEQVSNMVRAGLGDESGAKLIEQRGIDFAPTEDFLQSLKTAGASEAFLKAVRAAKQPEAASAKRKNRATVHPAAQARLDEFSQHVARGMELEHKGEYALAEQEYRAALLLDSQNTDLYVRLSHVLNQQKKWDDGAAAARQVLHLKPKNYMAHFPLAVAIGHKGDWDGSIAEFREALRLNPKNDMAHYNLGGALGLKNDVDGAIAEYREALRLNPKNEDAHVDLGVALGHKGDWDGRIAEERAALRRNPKNDMAHYNLGGALGLKNDVDGAIAEFHAAYMLDPKNATYKQYYEGLLQQKEKR
jgi:tetratricopeptide (TPR) repeat protein